MSNQVVVHAMWAIRSALRLTLVLGWMLTSACGRSQTPSGSPAQPNDAPPQPTLHQAVADCDFSAYRPLRGSFEGQVIRHSAKPIYPSLPRRESVAGRVVVEVLVDASGTPVKACTVSGHMLLRSASEEAALRFLFEPILLNGKPVPFVVHMITFTYQLK